MKSSKEKRLGTGRVAFLARLEIFKEKILAGHTITSVFEEYEKELGGIGYKQFVNYVNRYIRSKPKEKSLAETETKIAEKELSTSEYLRSRPNKKDLLNG